MTSTGSTPPPAQPPDTITADDEKIRALSNRLRRCPLPGDCVHCEKLLRHLRAAAIAEGRAIAGRGLRAFAIGLHADTDVTDAINELADHLEADGE